MLLNKCYTKSKIKEDITGIKYFQHISKIE